MGRGSDLAPQSVELDPRPRSLGATKSARPPILGGIMDMSIFLLSAEFAYVEEGEIISN